MAATTIFSTQAMGTVEIGMQWVLHAARILLDLMKRGLNQLELVIQNSSDLDIAVSLRLPQISL